MDTSTRFLHEKYRIRVTAYENKDGTHDGLLRFLQNLDDFVLPRASVKLTNSFSVPQEKSESSAPGFFVFSKLSKTNNIFDKQMAAILAAMQAVMPTLSKNGKFTIETALHLAGWPDNMEIPSALLTKVTQEAVKEKMIFAEQDKKYWLMLTGGAKRPGRQ